MEGVGRKMNRIRKLITGTLGAVCLVLYQYNVVHPDPKVSSILVVLTAYGIWRAPNDQPPLAA